MSSSPIGRALLVLLSSKPAPRVVTRRSPRQLMSGLKPGIGIRNLNIQVDDFQRVLFDKFAAGFDVFAHEGGENILGGYSIFELYLQ